MKKDLFALSVAVFLLILVCSGTKIQSVEDYYQTHIDDITEDSETVFLTVRCDAVLDRWDDLNPSLKAGDVIPQDGMLLVRTEYVLRKGDTVYDILNRAVRHSQIHMECSSAGGFGVYVRGIGQLYEFDCGELSGWQYLVNGEAQSVGCDRYLPADGDEIVWYYTCDLGRDAGAAVQGQR